MCRARRGPGIKGLVESDGSGGHRISVHVPQTESDLAGDAGVGEVLRGAGDRFEVSIFGARAESCEVDALGGAIEAGGGGGLLAVGERPYGEGFSGDTS